MKKNLLCLLLVCFTSLFSAPLQDRSLNPEALNSLAASMGLDLAQDLNSQMQKRWLRPPNQERWELTEFPSDQKKLVLNWAENQGLFKEWAPLDSTYDKALILGATTGRMQKRLDYLKTLWERGVRFNEVIFLTGQRPLDPRIDAHLKNCSTESDAARFLWEHTELSSELRSLPVLFIEVPMKQEGSSLKRPNTEDTLVAWMATHPSACKALFVSCQPFCGYQFAVLKATLPESLFFDLVGPGETPSGHPSAAAITLDSIARQVHAENLAPKTKKE